MQQRSFSRRPNSGFRQQNHGGGGSRIYSSRRPNRIGGGYGRRFSRAPKMKGIHPSKYIAKAIHEEVIPYEPKNKFSDFDISPIIKNNIAKKNYVHPTKIQDQAIPYILEGKDVIGLASTGSGKTAAFLIPLINKVIKDKTQKVLIVVPTRELANQIVSEFKLFAWDSYLKYALVIGGASMRNQAIALRSRPNFIIGTPGRLKDLYERKIMNLSEFNNIVLDEVDRMLDMGFVDDIKYLISKLTPKKQSLFFSATMNNEAEGIAHSLLNNPVKVQVETQSSSKNVDQDVVKISTHEEKVEVLHNLLVQEEFRKVLIFSKTKIGSDKLSSELRRKGHKVDSIHGDKSQFKRDQVIFQFKREYINILVATDVAARGLDIPDITHVINYDEPATIEDYIHRIGRTGRAGKKGKALTFVKHSF